MGLIIRLSILGRIQQIGSATAEDSGRRVLDGCRVLELGQVYNVPYCGLLLAQFGAEVIKIEPPQGEPARHRPGGQDATPFVMLNSNKRGVRLNLKTDAGRMLLIRLVQTSDVLVENYRHGALDRLGLSAEVLLEANPRLILARGRGFSSRGPLASLPAMDLTVQAMTGVMASTGFPDQPPVKAGPAVADFLGGVHLLAGILAALLQREQTGHGQVVEVAMQDALLPALASNLAGLLDRHGAGPQRTGNHHGGLGICPYNTYAARDGFLAILCATDRQWLALCEVMERPDLAQDPALATNPQRAARMDEIDAIVAAWTASRARHEVLELLSGAGVAAAPVLGLDEVLSHPQVHASGMLPTIAHPRKGSVPVFGSPIHLAASPPRPPTPAPALGEDTRAVLREHLGLSDTELDHLAASGAI